MQQKGREGFTLIEVIVVAGIIAVIAGILVPIIFKEIDEAKKSRAMADIKSISSAMLVFRKDLGIWPSKLPNCVSEATMLISNSGELDDGKMHFSARGFDGTKALKLAALYINLGGCYTNWKGPYMASVTADPWGNAYIINSNAFAGTSGVWLLSAGPNGCVDTDAAGDLNGSPCTGSPGDDIGIRLQ